MIDGFMCEYNGNIPVEIKTCEIETDGKFRRLWLVKKGVIQFLYSSSLGVIGGCAPSLKSVTNVDREVFLAGKI
jgi:hypothetical protein